MTAHLPVVYDPDAWDTDEEDEEDEEIPQREAQVVYDALIEVCRRHGSVAAQPLLIRENLWADDDEDVDRDVDYYLPGWWSDEREIAIEPRILAVSEAWLSELATALKSLKQFPGWHVGITLDKHNSLYLFEDQILLSEKLLRGCKSASSIIDTLRHRQRCLDERLAVVRKLTAAAYLKAAQENLEIHLVAQYATWSDGTLGKSVWMLHRNLNEDYEFQLEFLKFAPFASLMAFYQLFPDGSISEAPPAEGKGVDLLVEWALWTSDWRPEFGESLSSHPSGRFSGEAISSVKFLYVESRELAWRWELDSECPTRTCDTCDKQVPAPFWHESDAKCTLCITDNWLDSRNIPCASCGRLLGWVLHSGFYAGSFFYCMECPRRVLVSGYDPVASAIRDDLEGQLGDDDGHHRLETKALEERLAPCRCGGTFAYEAPRRCVYCATVIPESANNRNVWPTDDDSPFTPLEITENIWR